MKASKCRDWSAWIDTIETSIKDVNKVIVEITVGIDLPELIRLKPKEPQSWSHNRVQVGIDLPELIRLKLYRWFKTWLPRQMSGLICLNWYDWNFVLLCNKIKNHYRRDWSAWIDTIETTTSVTMSSKSKSVGIDLPELIRLKQH